MELPRYTKFPDLSSPYDGEDPSGASYSWDTDFDVPQEVLVLSWASLLRSYTGSEEPVFRVATNAVKVDLLQRTISRVEATSSVPGSCEWTGVLVQKAPGSNRSTLQLQHDARLGRWSLESSGCIPLVQLSQIACQLRQAWAERLGISIEGNDIVLSTANLNPRVLEGPNLLHELPRFQLGEEGLAVEFLGSDGTLCGYSYASIDWLSTLLASRLRRVLQASGANEGSRNPIIPVLIPQSPELYVALLAILKAGAAFCPLNLDSPEERIKFVVRDVSARVIVTTRALERRFTWQEKHALVVADVSETDCNRREPIHLPQVDLKDIAYVMYTSGSTGVPKGVSVSHFAATQSLLAHDRYIPPFNRFLQFAAPTFDVFIFEMFFPLFRGSTLVGCGRDGLLNDLPSMIDRLRADAAELTPTVAGGLLQKRRNAPGLQVLLTIGEMLTSHVANEFGGSPTTKGILHGMYGPTEAAIHCTLATNFPAYSRVGIIGVPLDTVSALIIAPQGGPNSLEVLPVGQVGELVIGGHQLADGYFNRPEQTSQSFIETQKHGRLYRTGDRARLLSDGCLEFLGRISPGQVKLRGQRVELGEIEQVACRTDGVSNAAASVIDGTLVLFCSADIDEVSVKHVLDNCNRWLPKFMIPADVVLVRDLSRLPSGKIDRHRLDSDYIEARGNALSGLQRAANETERRIRDIVCNLLGRAIGRSASLAAAGLDSLLAIRLSSQLRMLGFSSSATNILKADTIERIGQTSSQSTSYAEHGTGVDRQDVFKIARESGYTQLLNLVPTMEASEVVPCTPLQTAMLAETVKDAKAYCNWVELEAHSTIKPEAIESAFKQLALQNEILRSGFIELEGPHSFGQVVWKDLPDTCFSEVPEFTYEYGLDTQLALLRPLRIQIREGVGGWRILVQIHHALYDGWSWEQLMGDLECILAGQRPRNRPPYRKLAEFYHQPSTTASLALSREFWQRNLQGVIPCTLPNLNGRNGIRPTLDVTSLRMSFLRAELESASRSLLASPQAFFQGAFAYLLGLYLGYSDVVFGVALSGRTLPLDHIEDIIGPFIATTPFRLDVSNSRTVRDLVQSAHKQSRNNLEHCALPLRDIRGSCGLRPGEVLFDTLLVYQQTLKSNVTEPRLVSQVGGADYLEFSLTLEIEPRMDHIYVKANYQRAIIPKGQVEILLEQLDQLVTTFIQSELLSLIDCRSCFHDRVLSIQNPNPQRRRARATLASFVEYAAQQCPGDIAIEFYNSIGSRRDVERLSYGELNMRANQVAHHLISLGVSPNELVCIYMEKSIDLYVSVLAVAKAGAGYLPLTPDTPRDRIRHILAEARVKQCVTHSNFWEILGTPEGTSGVCLDVFDFTPLPLSNPTAIYQSSNLAYAVFTSGSTGAPKGVLVTQENLLSNLDVLRDTYSVEKGSRLLQSCSQAFDVSVFEIYFAWCSRICLCSTTMDVLFQDIEAAIRDMEISHLSLTPTVAALVDPKNVPDVRFLVTAGEALTQRVFDCWVDRGLHQGYGPSETTNICTIKRKVSSSDSINNIGTPFGNTSAFVVYDDEEIILLPRGGVGEFCFGGDQVCRGYLNMPELTSQKFINHPQFGRLYRSGDYGRLHSDGSLQFVGRRDDQIKIRGQRVELGEIASVILKSSMTLDCTTLLATESNSEFQKLVCFWVPKARASKDFQVLSPNSDIKLTVSQLFCNLVSTIPTYMLPSFLVPLSTLPMTDQGKIDKRRLLATFRNFSVEYWEPFSRQVQHSGPEEGWSDSGREVASTISDIFNVPVDRIHPSTSLFSLGLDSISAISLSRVLKSKGIGQLEVSTILRHPTISSLCGEISRSLHLGEREESKIPLEGVFGETWLNRVTNDFKQAGRLIKKVLPCTPLQEAMLSKADSKVSTAYYSHTVFEIHGDLDRLKTCWSEIVSRHDILRTCFLATDNLRYAFAQVILEQYRPTWSLIETSALKDELSLKDCISTIASSFNELEPPYLFTPIRSPHRTLLLLSMHHALYDGRALRQLLEEVQRAYLGVPLPAIVPFELFLERVVSADLEEAGRYWGTMLKDFRPSPFPEMTGKSPSYGRMLTGNIRARLKSTMSLSSINNACKGLSISLLALNQAAWVKILAAYLGIRDICFGNVVSCRTIPLEGVEKIVAPCFNTLPVRVQFTHSTTTLELIETLQNVNANSLPHQLTPLRYIQSNYSKDGLRVFDTLFILQEPQQELDDRVWSIVEDIGDMGFPIICEVVPIPHEDSLEFILHCDRSSVLEEDTSRILQTFNDTLQSCLSYPSNSVADFGFLDSSFLSTTNETFAVSSEPGMLLHSEFERNVRERPRATALDFLYPDGKRTIWTFEELNHVSNQISHVLLENGVRREEAVSICMYKSPLFYASILGVLKTGAAFTPMDPQSSSGHKSSMMRELQARAVLSNSTVDTSWCAVKPIILDTEGFLCTKPKYDPPIERLSHSSLAYIVYTSGSTKQPKVVGVQHGNAVQRIECSRDVLPWTPETRLLQYAATTFHMCYFDCFVAWNFGFCLCSTTQASMLDNLISTINTMGITMLDLTPTVASSFSRSLVPSVQCLHCYGEATPQWLADNWIGKFVNSYGSTETGICCAIRPTTPGTKSTLIGSPFPSITFTVLSKDTGYLAPRLGIGELYIGGPQLDRGFYHTDQELPLSRATYSDARKVLYKSGDIVRMFGNGYFEYIGRTTNIDPNEINDALKAGHPDVTGVVTLAIKCSENSEDELVSFLAVPKPSSFEGFSSENEYRDSVRKAVQLAVRGKLPAYMIPKNLVTLSNIPLSPSGKVDKQALISRFRQCQPRGWLDEGGSGDETLPDTLLCKDENELIDILSHFSGVSRRKIGRDTTIYRLGLDSISAAQIASELRSSGRTVTAADILERPSISRLVPFLRETQHRSHPQQPMLDFMAFEQRHRKAIVSQLSITNAELQAIRPCTPIQAGMVAQFLSSEGTLYFNHLLLELPKGTNINKILEAWGNAMHRHDLLRTGFAGLDSKEYAFAMLTYRVGVLDLPFYYLDGALDTPESLNRQRRACASQVFQSFHLPAWRLGINQGCRRTLVQFSAHHALYDAQSLQIILRDVAEAYNGCSNTAAPSLNGALSAILNASRTKKQHEQFWRDIGKDLLVSKFPSMTPLRVESEASHVLSKVYSKTRRELESSCKLHGFTIQAVGEAAWARVLAAYTGESSVTFGLVLSGRTDSGITQETAFPCLATVPVAVKIQEGNKRLVQHIMGINSAILKYQFTPLSDIQRWTGHVGEKLFDTIFVYQKLTSHSGRYRPPWEVVDEDASTDYAISVELEPTGEELVFRITFREDTLPVEQAMLLLDQLDAAMRDTLASPETQATDMSLLPNRLLSIVPAKEELLHSEVNLLHQFVESQCQTTPKEIALEFVTSLHDETLRKTWTYEELDAEGNKIANLLTQSGSLPADLITICFDKCPEASFAILGILKAGCAFVALDPNAPIARKLFITKDSQSKRLLTTMNHALELQQAIGIPVICLDNITGSNSYPTLPPILPRKIEPGDVCYCLYTSGTTGTPKGCEITHESAVQAMLAFQQIFRGHWSPGSKFLQFASFHFDVSVLEQYWSWSVGICVSSAPRDVILGDIAGTIRGLNITHIDLTPSLASLLHPDEVPSLCRGVFITGGEQLKQEILDVWGPKGVIYNGYGPTEATIGCTMFPRVPVSGKPSNIGPQFDNVGSYVLLPKSTAAAIRGGAGELCVSGKLVGRGYLNLPELTQEKFPYIPKYQERVYRTGDLVRLLHDGTFDFLGRADDQVKLRGQRLEIGEINETIKASVNGVREIATLVLQHSKQQKEQLVSFVVLKAPTQQKTSKIQLNPLGSKIATKILSACRAKLPGYMIPTHFVAIQSIPLSANNKTDAKQLSQIYKRLSLKELQKLSSTRNGPNRPSTDREAKLLKILSKATSTSPEDIDISSNVFELGLDSISVIRFAHLLKEAGFGNAQALVIMKYPTMGQLAHALKQEQRGQSSANKRQLNASQNILAFVHRHADAISRDLGMSLDLIGSIAPCTPLQEGMIFRSLENHRPLYFGSFYFELQPSTNIPKLRDAWEAVVARTQILRTRFSSTPDGFAQAVVKEQEIAWDEVYVSSEDERKAVTEDRYLAWWRRVRDLRNTPFEISIVQSPTRSVMCLHIFHALYDGNSLPTLLMRVYSEYFGTIDVDYGPPFHDVLPYGPLCEDEEAKEFWTQHLSGLKSCRMPSLIQDPVREDSLVTMDLRVPGLEATRRSLSTTHQGLIQACWISVLQKYLPNPVTIGVVVSGRSIDLEGIGNTIGPLFNTIPCYISFQKTDTWTKLVRECHDFNAAALPHQHTALRDIAKWCRRSPDMPLFDTLFVFQKDDENSMPKFQDLWTPLYSSCPIDYPLAFEAHYQVDETLKLTIVAQGTTSSNETSLHLLKEFGVALHQLIEDPDSLMSTTQSKSHRATASKPIDTAPKKAFSEAQPQYSWTTESRYIQREVSALAEIDVSCIKETSSIFELGLDSIDAIKLSSRLKQGGINLSVGAIMKSLTIPKMASVATTIPIPSKQPIELNILDDFEDKLRTYFRSNEILVDHAEQILPVTPLQEAMVAKMYSSNFFLYFNHDILQLNDTVDLEKLKLAWEIVTKNTPILRTSFYEVDDPDIPFSYAQIIHRSRGTRWRITQVHQEDDVQALTNKSKADAAEVAATGPAVSITVLEGPKKRFLVLSMAHALYDGWSMSLLHQDVRKAYYGEYLPRRSIRETLGHILSSSSSEAANFWRTYLLGVKVSRFPGLLDDQRFSKRVQHHLELHSSLPATELKSFCKMQGVTLQALGQTCWAFVLASYVKSLEVVFGTILSGRDTDSAHDVVFPTMNTVTVRAILHGTRGKMLQYIQENITNIVQYQHYPLRNAQASVNLGGQRLFDTLFIYQKRPEDDPVRGSLYESVGGSSVVEYPVCTEMELVDDTLVWRTACEAKITDSDLAKDILERLETALREIVYVPDAATIDFTEHDISISNLPGFPRNPKSLPGSPTDERQSHHGSLTEWSTQELAIRAVLSKVSRVPEDEISKDLTIFHLGLDSISAIKVSSLLGKQSIKLSVSELLRAATVDRMAHLLQANSIRREPSTVKSMSYLEERIGGIDAQLLFKDAGIDGACIESHMPASAGQVYMLSAWQNSRGAILYPCFFYEIESVLDRKRLDEAWSKLHQSSPILRTTFLATEKRDLPFIQAIFRQVKNPVIWFSDGEKASASRPLGFEFPPVTLYARYAPHRTILQLEIHHALYDGVSLPILMQHLQGLYSYPDRQLNTASSYREFLSLNFLTPQQDRRQRRFWETYLGPSRSLIPPVRLVGTDKRVEVFTPGVQDTGTTLDSLARSRGVSLQVVFLAAYSKVYARLIYGTDSTEDGDIAFGVYLANRGLPVEGLLDLTAPTLNLVPLRIVAPLKAPITDISKRIQADLQDISSIQNSGVGLWEIEDWTGLKFNCFVNFLKLPDSVKSDPVPDRDNQNSFELVTPERRNPRREVVETRKKDFVEPKALKSSAVKDVYLPSLDIEATIRDGRLDIGAFCPEELLSLETVEKLISDTREILESYN